MSWRAVGIKIACLLFVLSSLEAAARDERAWASSWYEAAKNEKQVVWYTSLNEIISTCQGRYDL